MRELTQRPIPYFKLLCYIEKDLLPAVDEFVKEQTINPLPPKDSHSGRSTAPLTSKSCILYIYSTNTVLNILNMVYTVRFFPLQNAVCFIILTYLVPVLFTFSIQNVLKFKENNSGAKRLSIMMMFLKN